MGLFCKCMITRDIQAPALGMLWWQDAGTLCMQEQCGSAPGVRIKQSTDIGTLNTLFSASRLRCAVPIHAPHLCGSFLLSPTRPFTLGVGGRKIIVRDVQDINSRPPITLPCCTSKTPSRIGYLEQQQQQQKAKREVPSRIRS